MCYHQINTFAVSKDEWDTNKDTGKTPLGPKWQKFTALAIVESYTCLEALANITSS